MSSKQLELCKNLYQAVLACKQQCEQLVPRSFSSCLLEALQHLMLQAVQVQQVRTQIIQLPVAACRWQYQAALFVTAVTRTAL